MRRAARILGFLLCGIALALGPTQRAGSQAGRPAPSWSEFERLTPELRELAVTWLLHSCSAGGDQGLADRVKGAGTRLEAAFWEAWWFGPPPEQVASARQAFRGAYRQNRVWLRQGCEPLLGAEECRRQLRVSESESVGRQLANAHWTWQEAALLGLGLVGGEKTLAELARIAAGQRPGAAAAAAALRRRGEA